MAEGWLLRRDPGESVRADGVVGFVLRGGLAVFDARDFACVQMLEPGSTFGWDAALMGRDAGQRMLALLETQWIEVPARLPGEVMGAAWVERVFARHAFDRLQRVQTLSACHAVHSVSGRVANLILNLARATDTGDVRTTQAALAEAVGVQRTSVNAAIKALQDAGAVSVRRGRLRVVCHDTLGRFACGCG